MDVETTLVDVSCVVHVHTTYSDGTATVPSSSPRPRTAGAEAVLADRSRLARPRGATAGRARHDGVFLLVGTEVSPKQGHYLAFGVEREIPHAGRSARRDRAGGARGGRASASPRTRSRAAATCSCRRSRAGSCCRTAGRRSRTRAAATASSCGASPRTRPRAWRTPAEALRWLRDPEAAIAGGPPGASPAPVGRAVGPPAGAGDRRARRPPARASACADASARRCRTGARSASCARTCSASAR